MMRKNIETITNSFLIYNNKVSTKIVPFYISTGREADYELDLFMWYSADKLSIPIDETLFFDEPLTVLLNRQL